MESDDDRTPIGVQSLRKGTGEKGLQVFKFVVDGDPQSLKDAGGGMHVGVAGGRSLAAFLVGPRRLPANQAGGEGSTTN